MSWCEPDAVATVKGRWRVQRPGGRMLWFDESGRLAHVVDGHRDLTLNYCGPNDMALGNCLSTDALLSVVGANGRRLDFSYTTVPVPAGTLGDEVRPAVLVAGISANGVPVAQYGYDTLGRLSRAELGDLSLHQGRQYLYGEPAHLCLDGAGAAVAGCDPAHFPHHLTGVIDESGARFADYTYDGFGRVSRSEHAGGTGRVSLVYSSTTAIDVTLPLGTRKTYQIVDGAFRKPGATQLSSGGGTVLSSSSQSYSDFRVSSQVGPTGSRTDYTYDAFHETSRTEALTSAGAGTPEQRTIQTTWHATLNLPVEQRILNAANTLIQRRTWTYNARGQELTRTDTDPVSGATRTITKVYCEDADVSAGVCPLAGVLRSQKGPRTDVDDTTRYTYYADTSFSGADPNAEGHTIGDLSRVTNAKSQVTQFTKYDRHGNLLESVDANGVLTRNVFDA